MKQEMVRQIQEHIFVLFKQYDCMCRDNNLRYYFLGGTMLGAVRHKGFIPWDDDIDVGMPRDDYDRLLTLYKEAGYGQGEGRAFLMRIWILPAPTTLRS